jgi:hypothetical protein
MADDDFTLMWQAIDSIRDRAEVVDKRTSVHEAVCAERYKGINNKLNYIIVGIALLAIGEMLGLGKAVGAFFRWLGMPT